MIKSLTTLLLLSLSTLLLNLSTAHAVSRPFRPVFQRLAVQVQYEPGPLETLEGTYYLFLNTTDGRGLHITAEDLSPALMTLSAELENLSGPQKQAFGQFAGNLAATCMNLSREHADQLARWVTSQLNRTPEVHREFGPVSATVEQLTRPPRQPYVVLNRQTPHPGQAPWLNYCGTPVR